MSSSHYTNKQTPNAAVPHDPEGVSYVQLGRRDAARIVSSSLNPGRGVSIKSCMVILQKVEEVVLVLPEKRASRKALRSPPIEAEDPVSSPREGREREQQRGDQTSLKKSNEIKNVVHKTEVWWEVGCRRTTSEEQWETLLQESQDKERVAPDSVPVHPLLSVDSIQVRVTESVEMGQTESVGSEEGGTESPSKTEGGPRGVVNRARRRLLGRCLLRQEGRSTIRVNDIDNHDGDDDRRRLLDDTGLAVSQELRRAEVVAVERKGDGGERERAARDGKQQGSQLYRKPTIEADIIFTKLLVIHCRQTSVQIETWPDKVSLQLLECVIREYTQLFHCSDTLKAIICLSFKVEVTAVDDIGSARLKLHILHRGSIDLVNIGKKWWKE
ncbi:hypothetical protein BDY19DRAFT_1051615 [Irpex rosettiformis]|uniref:Uncharacterized protein n=1 Tax=Irpex rosettiformis TaxID=378272 RepID=A0ACB8TPH5_9APHY|nr:hypothetical protein BDY19DRAFT_1051615 [Irpex rosettiformis]